jgi:hydroxymethylbilane synthase
METRMPAERPKLTIGTRGSKLALWQSQYIRSRIEGSTGLEVEIKVIKTTGDKILDVPLAMVGGKGLFTKELEVELASGAIDLAVHSMKDVPTELPDGLVIAAMPERVDPRDAIVSGGAYTLDTLPPGARVGTSSLRRVAQVRALRPDVVIVDVRGNLDTRMRKAETGELDAVILAAAGITRMGWAERITHYIPTSEMVSAVGQGAIGVEIREDDELMQDVCARLADPLTMTCVGAERVVMRMLEGGCQVPIGAFARFEDGRLVMDAIVGSVDGTTVLREHLEGDASDPEALGAAMVERLLARGAGAILAAIRDASVLPSSEVDSRLET